MMTEGLFYSSVDEVDSVERKHRLPVAVTTPKRGPLILSVVTQQPHKVGQHSQLELHGGSRTFPKAPAPRPSLNRFPVTMVEQPLQMIEADLGHLSCAMLQTTIHQTLPTHSKAVILPHLHPMMKYSPLTNGIRGNNMAPPLTWHRECHAHREGEGNIGVSITYSRHLHQPPSHTPPPPHHTTHSLPPPNLSAPISSPTPHYSGLSTSLRAPQREVYTYPDPLNTRYYKRHHPPEPLVTPSPSGCSLAPPSLQAVVTHRRKPLTHHTTLRGHRISTMS